MKLQLSLKTKWFELTKAGIKKEDYREITPYWCSRFLEYKGMKIKSANFDALFRSVKHEYVISFINDNYDFKQFIKNRITLGYPSSSDTDRIIEFEHDGIEIRTGNPDWGAESNKLYFVIKHGKPIT